MYLPYLAALLTVVLWGATPAATEVAVREIDALLVGVLRTVFAGALLLPLALALRLRLPEDRAGWLTLATASACGFVGFTLLFTLGIAMTSTAHAALIIAAAPVFTGVMGFVAERNWPRPGWWLGAGIAMLGEAVLIGYRAEVGAPHPATLHGDLVVLASAIVVSAGYVAGGRLSVRIGTWATTAWSAGFAALALVPLLGWLLLSGEAGPRLAWSPPWLAVAYLAFGSSVLAYAAWYWAIGVGGVKRVAPVQFLQPVVSLVLAVAVFAEPITLPIGIALLAISAGIVVTRRAG